jgi:hypothetical protein
MTEDAFGYVPGPGETLVRSDEVVCILVYSAGRPIKIIYPDGRVEPYTGRASQIIPDKRVRTATQGSAQKNPPLRGFQRRGVPRLI